MPPPPRTRAKKEESPARRAGLSSWNPGSGPGPLLRGRDERGGAGLAAGGAVLRDGALLGGLVDFGREGAQRGLLLCGVGALDRGEERLAGRVETALVGEVAEAAGLGDGVALDRALDVGHGGCGSWWVPCSEGA